MSGGLGFGKSKGSKGVNPLAYMKQMKEILDPLQGDLLDETEAQIAGRPANTYLANMGSGLEDTYGRMGSALDSSNLQELLIRQAGASTDQASIAAVRAARMAGGARGGLAYGGGAGALAGRAGAQAGALGGSAILSGMVGAEQARLSGISMLGQVGSSLAQTRGAQAGLFQQITEGDIGKRLGARERFLQLLGGMSGSVGSGAGGAAQTASRSMDVSVKAGK